MPDYTTRRPPFHFAFPVNDLEAAREFYVNALGCTEGRSSTRWIDFDFYGHQIVAHLSESNQPVAHNPVDGHNVPIPHFGIVINCKEWERLVKKLRAYGIKFLIEPCTRFAGKPGEQATMFFLDPAGNAIEIKSFKNLDNLFSKQDDYE